MENKWIIVIILAIVFYIALKKVFLVYDTKKVLTYQCRVENGKIMIKNLLNQWVELKCENSAFDTISYLTVEDTCRDYHTSHCKEFVCKNGQLYCKCEAVLYDILFSTPNK